MSTPPSPPTVEIWDYLLVFWAATAAGMCIIVPAALIVAASMVARAQRRVITAELLAEAEEAGNLARWMREQFHDRAEEVRPDSRPTKQDLEIHVVDAAEWGRWTKKDEEDYKGSRSLVDRFAPQHDTNEGGVAP